jgi:small subunit ribosomal protein S8
MTDPIADFLTRVRNSLIVKHDRLDVPTSKLKQELSALLQAEGYIAGFEVIEEKPQSVLRVFLRYDDQGVPAIRKLRRISKPGRRVYRGADEIKPILNGIGTSVISTSKGLLSDSEARSQRVGGEVVCEIW